MKNTMHSDVLNEKNTLLKTAHIILSIFKLLVMLILAGAFIYLRFQTDYTIIMLENLDSYNPFGIENSVFYSAVAIVALASALVFFGCIFIKRPSVKVNLCIDFFVIIVFAAASFIQSGLTDVNIYESDSVDSSVADCLPIDHFEYTAADESYYYLKEVSVPGAYWAGSISYKVFNAGKDSEISVYMTYYYLKDDTGNRISECDFGTWNNVINSNEIIEKHKGDDYVLYEYENYYEFELADANTVFKLTAARNEKSTYTAEDIIAVSKALVQQFETK